MDAKELVIIAGLLGAYFLILVVFIFGLLCFLQNTKLERFKDMHTVQEDDTL